LKEKIPCNDTESVTFAFGLADNKQIIAVVLNSRLSTISWRWYNKYRRTTQNRTET